MKLNKIKYLILGTFFLLCSFHRLFAFDEFVQFTYYGQLTWDSTGTNIAFHCILLDEARPENINSNMLLKDLDDNKLYCLDPKPEQFRISKDKKILLFSCAYGLYRMELSKPGQLHQLLFRDPSANFWFSDFGFTESNDLIYIEFSSESGEKKKSFYEISTNSNSKNEIGYLKLEGVNIKDIEIDFNLSRNGFTNKVKDISLKNSSFKFEMISGKSQSTDYNLVFEDKKKSSKSRVLIRNCRPRLMSISPDSSKIVTSVFEGLKHNTYLISLKNREMIQLSEKRTFAISWLGDSQIIYIDDDGLFRKDISSSRVEDLNKFDMPEFCQNMDLSLPKYELQVGFVSEKQEAEKIIQNLNKLGFSSRMIYFANKSAEGYRIRVGGYKDRDAAESAGKKLREKGIDYWIDKISNYYEFYNSPKDSIQKSFNSKIGIVEYKLENYLRSRIILKEGTIRRIIVDEMNNIPNRTEWKLEMLKNMEE